MHGESRAEREKLFSAQVRTAECHAAKSILDNDASAGGVFRIIDNARALAETVYEVNRYPNAPAVMCKEGCCWCCHQTVRVTAPEAFRIADFLRSLEDGARGGILERLHELDKRTRGLSGMARTELHAPCAFLKDGRCEIYRVRPFECAGFTSYNLDDCVHGYQFGFDARGVVTDNILQLVYDAVREGVGEGLREALPELDTSPLELSAAVVDALSSPDAADQWLAGEPVFERAHLAQDSE